VNGNALTTNWASVAGSDSTICPGEINPCLRTYSCSIMACAINNCGQTAAWVIGVWGACTVTQSSSQPLTCAQSRSVSCQVNGASVGQGSCPTPVPVSSQPCTCAPPEYDTSTPLPSQQASVIAPVLMVIAPITVVFVSCFWLRSRQRQQTTKADAVQKPQRITLSLREFVNVLAIWRPPANWQVRREWLMVVCGFALALAGLIVSVQAAGQLRNADSSQNIQDLCSSVYHHQYPSLNLGWCTPCQYDPQNCVNTVNEFAVAAGMCALTADCVCAGYCNGGSACASNNCIDIDRDQLAKSALVPHNVGGILFVGGIGLLFWGLRLCACWRRVWCCPSAYSGQQHAAAGTEATGATEAGAGANGDIALADHEQQEHVDQRYHLLKDADGTTG